MKRYLLDTNIISHLMRVPHGSNSLLHQAIRERAQHDCEFITSPIVQCELLFGIVRRASVRQMAAYELQMAYIDIAPIDDSVGPHYARLRTALERAGTPIGPNDTLIAAHALALGATLVSADNEFARVPDLQFENWLAAKIFE